MGRQKMDEWLHVTTSEIEECYDDSLEELRNKVCEIRLRINELQLHAQKLGHLNKIPLASVESLRQRTDSPRKGSSMKGFVPMRDQPPPAMSMNLGSRLYGLSKSVGVSDEEASLLLTQLLYIASPDAALLSKLNHCVNYYSKKTNRTIV